MPRKKHAKRSAKHNTSKILPLQKLEKDFLNSPAKLNAALNKEIKALKQKENKLRSSVNKIKAKIKISAHKLKQANKQKHTNPQAKKQFTLAKRTHAKHLKTETHLNKALSETSKSIEGGNQKQSKLIALRKHLKDFEKNWGKSAKQAKPKAKRKAKAHKAKVSPTMSEFYPKQEPRPESYEITPEDVRLDETTEITS